MIEHDFSVPDDPAEFEVWIAQQTAEVQRAAKVFPLGYPVQLNERMVWVVGYTPEGEVVTITRDPTTLTVQQLEAEIERCILIDPESVITHAQRH